MKVDYKIRKENQDVCIVVEVCSSFCYSNFEYRIVDIGTKTKEQRKFRFKASIVSNDYSYRKLDIKEKEKYVREMVMAYVTKEDIQKAVDFAYEKIKPKFNDVKFCIF